MYLCFFIYDLINNCYLTDKSGEKIHHSTIFECLDYLEYVEKIDDFSSYEFRLGVSK